MKRNIILVLIVLFAAGAVVFFSSNVVAPEVEEGDEAEEVSPEENDIDVSLSGEDGMVFEYGDGSVGVLEKITPPSLNREIPEGGTQSTRDRILVLHKELTGDPGNFSGWVELGVMYKALEYYDGAEEIWLFTEKMRPESSMPNANLAVLYGWYMKDIEAAKIHFDRAIEKEPTRVALYGQAYEFYRDVVKDEATGLTYVQKGYDLTKDSVLGSFLEDKKL